MVSIVLVAYTGILYYVILCCVIFYKCNARLYKHLHDTRHGAAQVRHGSAATAGPLEARGRTAGLPNRDAGLYEEQSRQASGLCVHLLPAPLLLFSL